MAIPIHYHQVPSLPHSYRLYRHQPQHQIAGYASERFYRRTEYGVIFRPVPNAFIPSDSYMHVFFELQFPVIPDFPTIPTINDSQCTDQVTSFGVPIQPTIADTHNHF